MQIELALDRKKRPFYLEPSRLAKHAAVLAQSGSGKSFMIGRLIEELAMKTKARIVVLDPNSDFIRLNESDEKIWKDPKFKPYFFPKESWKKFGSIWEKLKITIASNRNLPSAKRLVLDWGSLSHYEMSAVMNVDPNHDSDLYWCLFLTWQTASQTWNSPTETYYDFDHFREQSDNVIEFLLSGYAEAPLRDNPLAKHLRATLSQQIPLRFKSLIESLGEYQIWRSRGDGEIDLRKFVPGSDEAPKVLVIDLQSLSKDEERFAIVTNILDSLWERGRLEQWEATRDIDKPDTRVRTFIVIDEAHNLVPSSKVSHSIQQLSSKIVRIAAEGRKYGLHLLVATQRPRKIDSNVLTECDNLFLMKMTNDADIEFAVETFGFLSLSTAKLAKSFSVGDLLLTGSLNGGSTVFHASPRRTIQGGRDIPDAYWSTP